MAGCVRRAVAVVAAGALVGVLAAVVSVPAAVAQGTKRAVFGKPLTLPGVSPGERVRVRPYKLMDPLPPPSFDDDPGYRFVGVMLSVTNVGRGTVRDSPTNGAKIVTTGGRAISATVLVDEICDSFDGSVTIPRRQVRRGCVGFKVPAGARLKYFELTWSSGFADQTGQWSMARAVELRAER